MGRRDAQHRGLEQGPHAALGDRGIRRAGLSGDRAPHRAERMQKYVDLFDYGNRDIGGGIDQFWLTGNLRIDPIQQIDFVDRLRRGVLPVSKRSQDLMRDILPVTKVGDATIRAKSGLLGAEQGKPSLGWMVGWVEKGLPPPCSP